jgi:hypothetical protein
MSCNKETVIPSEGQPIDPSIFGLMRWLARVEGPAFRRLRRQQVLRFATAGGAKDAD